MANTNLSERDYDSGIKTKKWVYITMVLLLLQTFVNLASSGWNYAEFSQNSFLYDFLYFFIALYFIIKLTVYKYNNAGLSKLFQKEKTLLLFIGFYMLLFFVFGDRGPVLRMGLLCVALFSFYYKEIPMRKLIILAMIGVAAMFFVRQTRTGSVNLANSGVSALSEASSVFSLEDGAIYMFADLYGCNMELNIAYEYVQKKGLFHPEKAFYLPSYAVPLLPTLLIGDTEKFNTGAELNKYMSEYNPTFGNHIVGDCYMSFGLLGVVIFSIIFGKFSGFLFQNQKGRIVYRIMYLILISYSLYLPRDSMFSLIRPMFMCYLIWLILYIFRRKSIV